MVCLLLSLLVWQWLCLGHCALCLCSGRAEALRRASAAVQSCLLYQTHLMLPCGCTNSFCFCAFTFRFHFLKKLAWIRSSLQWWEKRCFPPDSHPQPQPPLLRFLWALEPPLLRALAAAWGNSSWRHQRVKKCSCIAVWATHLAKHQWQQMRCWLFSTRLQALGWRCFCPPFCQSRMALAASSWCSWDQALWAASSAFSKNVTKAPVKAISH